MRISASAPGKLVLLGEYLVLDGATALVMACDRRCKAEIRLTPGANSRLTTCMPDPETTEFAAGQASGATLVDTVVAELAPQLQPQTWKARLDSSAFFAGKLKLGLGSSAAALVAFAGACRGASGQPQASLMDLVEAHRAFQGGAGSGIDVAASLTGGTLRFQLDSAGQARAGSVRLPKSVGFAGVFAGGSASTPGLVSLYRQWADAGSAGSASLRQQMRAVAEEGNLAVAEGDGAAFVAAIASYGDCLARLGDQIGADLVTDVHGQIGQLAAKYGLAYKVSGAGGGDVGIACGLDADALESFSRHAADEDFLVVSLKADEHGLMVEEHAA